MHDFFKMMRQYASPYKGYLAGAVILNMLSAIFNIFSFAVIVPLLNILFKVDTLEYAFIPWGTEGMKFKDILVNNAYWLVSDFSAAHGAVTALLLLCLIMIFFTALKTSCYFGSAAVMIPIRTGIVKDIRNRIYNKILALPIGFFSQERKGDIIARMSGDVNEVENSITASIEMLIKDPILILFYFGILIFLSPEMMLVMFTFVPAFIWIMGVIGKQLKRQSLEAQTLWSDTMSQVEETLGGLRIVKAFNAEKKMSSRFDAVTDRMRRKVNRVNTRQASAHPVSEFLGTVMIMAVLAFGGYLIIRGKGLFGGTFMDASQFIFFMIILYSVIEPIKSRSSPAPPTASRRDSRRWSASTASWRPRTLSRRKRIRWKSRSSRTRSPSRASPSPMRAGGRSSRAWTWKFPAGRWSPSWANPAPGNPRSWTSSPASTMPTAAASPSTGRMSRT